MAKDKIVSFSASPEQAETWKEIARDRRVSLSRFIRDCIEQALGVVPAAPAKGPKRHVQAEAIATELKDRAGAVSKKVVAPSTGECGRRLPPGTYCKECGRTHD